MRQKNYDVRELSRGDESYRFDAAACHLPAGYYDIPENDIGRSHPAHFPIKPFSAVSARAQMRNRD